MIESNAMVTAVMTDPYESGVLKRDVHARLVAELDAMASDAGILPHWIYTPLAPHVGEEELTWVKRFMFHKLEGHTGLTMTPKAKGTKLSGVVDQMSAMAGALVRNFIRARVMTLNQVLEQMQDGGLQNLSCLLIPNFYIGKAGGADLPKWKTALLLDFLLERHLAGKQTVLFVSSFNDMSVELGTSFTHHIQQHYRTAFI